MNEQDDPMGVPEYVRHAIDNKLDLEEFYNATSFYQRFLQIYGLIIDLSNDYVGRNIPSTQDAEGVTLYAELVDIANKCANDVQRNYKQFVRNANIKYNRLVDLVSIVVETIEDDANDDE